MFVNGVEVISSRLENISLNISKMQPRADRPPVCSRGQLPLLHLTPSGASQKKTHDSPHQSKEKPWLLKPHHDIPPTPPPQTDPRPSAFFPETIG